MVTKTLDSDENAPRADMPITGVAPGAQYDPDIDLQYDISELPTVPLRAISPAATVKMPVVRFDVREVVEE